MDSNTQATKARSFLLPIAFTIFVIISAWYLALHAIYGNADNEHFRIWASSYQIMAAFGGFTGLFVARKWGGTGSVIGRAVTLFSIGLLLQVFGQSVNSYYNIFQNQQIPYPSLGDVGFMGSVVAYICGAFTLMKASGLRFSLRSTAGKFYGVAIPVVILAASYLFFLKGYEFDWTNVPKIMLDFAYPFGQALYVSLAVLAFVVSQDYLGGIMKHPVLSLVLALIVQYCSDFMFLYQANAGTWYAGGMNDYVYFISYFLMTLALISMLKAFQGIENKSISQAAEQLPV